MGGDDKLMYNYSVSLIIPAAHKADADKLAQALGHAPPGVPTFVAELSSDGVSVTHYGCHTYAQQAFVDTLTAAQQGLLPSLPWASYGLTEKDVQSVVQGLTVRIAKGTVADTWPDCMAAANVTLRETDII